MIGRAEERRLVLVWGGLVVATLASWLIGADHLLGEASHASAAAALLIGFVKVRFVGAEFMEVRGAPLLLRATFEVWVIVVGVTLATLLLAL